MHRGLVIGDVEAAGTPILLVHCMIDNRAQSAVAGGSKPKILAKLFM